MEKRVLLALLLSWFVFITWQRMFPAPQPVSQQKSSQAIENKEDVALLPGKANETFQPVSGKEVSRKPEERIFISNGKIEAELSTKGGSIVAVKVLDYGEILPARDFFQVEAFAGLDYEIDTREENAVVLIAKQQGVLIRKSFVLSDGDYIIKATVQVQNEGGSPLVFEPKVQAMVLDMAMMKADLDKSRDKNLLEYSVYSQEKVIRKTGAFKFIQKDNKKGVEPVEWFGFRDRYFCAIVRPDVSAAGYEFLAENSDEKKLFLYAFFDKDPLAVGETRSFSAQIYIGPQNSRILKEYGLFFEKIQVYFSLPFMDAIAKIIEDLVILMHKIVPNWGVAIIFVSLLIYFAMYPLTMKSMISMRKMQSLQPKIVDLRAKHEKNPQKLNQEIMKLYAENKVNPLGGCLPLLLQMPVFICLYQMIWRSILFKGAGFLWIKDLSEPDRLFLLKQSFPIIGNEINILPVIILVLMVVQQKMSSKNMVMTDPNQIAQQKMMMFMMPIVLLLVFYRIASGLTLYLAIFYIMSSFTQWRVAKVAQAME